MNIVCPRKLLAEFRRECRKRYPNEHFAAIYGLRSDEGNLLITKIAPIGYKSDMDGIELLNKNGINRAKRAALREDTEMLGTIHSHCHRVEDPTCWHLSATDIRSALKDGESICGLVYVYDEGHRTDVHWHIPSSPPSVVYVGNSPV